MTRTSSRKTAKTSKTTTSTAPSAAKTRKAKAQPEAASSAMEAPALRQPSNDAAPITSNASPRPGSKLAQVIGLLQREGGAALAELNSATGWLPHTTRAALTGLRKRGMALERLCDPDGTSRYHLARAA